MKRPEEVKVEFTIQWVKKAEIDLNTAEYLCGSGTKYVSAAAFHAQQAAEKYLKAFLIWHQIEFKKIHDIAALLRLASSVAPDLPVVLRDAESLTPYGVEYRYPGDYPQVNMALAQQALGIATRVRDEIRARLSHIVLSKEAQ